MLTPAIASGYWVDQMAQYIRFSLNISPEAFLRHYQGAASVVVVQADDGRRVQLPASSLRPFVSQQGIVGRFELELGRNNKLLHLKKLD